MPTTLELENSSPTKYDHADVTYHEDDEEEALSLSDLPVTKSNGGQATLYDTQNDDVDDFAFDFGSLLGSIPALESDMCVADEVFSGGQILPFRHSVSSESGIRVPNRVVPRNSSMDRTRFESCSSSRSSSTSSSNSRGLPDPKARNPFYSYPSPKARVKKSGRGSTSAMSYSGSRVTMWQVLRLGLVRNPEIELQGRSNTYMNKLSNNKNGSTNKIGDLLCERRNNNSLMYGSDDGGFFKSCKCSVGGAIEPLVTTRINGNVGSRLSSKSLASQVLNEDKERQKQKRNGNRRVSNHRTFEWLRDLSHPNILNL